MSKTSTVAAAAASKQSFDCLEQEAFLNLWRTYDRLKALEDKVFANVGLSAQQYNTLRLLQSVYPDSMPTLALGGRLISRAPDMTRLLDRLEQQGLLVRERRPENRRVVEVRITRDGMRLLDKIYDAVQVCHRQQLGHMNRKALRQLTELLKEVRQPHEDTENLSFVDE
jgi:MarR family transcriptional regulator, organic hydroperoxide resistance regulator